MQTAHIKSLPVPDQEVLLDELRQEVLVGAGKRDAPMAEYVTCDSCCRECTKNYYTTVVSQSTDESGATKQLDACALCFSRVGSAAVASSSEKAAAVQYVDGQPVRRLLTKADPNFDVLRKQMFKDPGNDPRNDTRGVREVAKTIQAKHRDEHGNSAPYTRKLVESSRKRRGWLCVNGKWQQGPNGVTGQGDPGPSPTKGRPKKVKTQVVSNTTAVATCDDPAAVANGGTAGGGTADPRRAREKELQKALRAARGAAKRDQRRHDRVVVQKNDQIAGLKRKLEATSTEPRGRGGRPSASAEDSARFADRELAALRRKNRNLQFQVSKAKRRKPTAATPQPAATNTVAEDSPSCLPFPDAEATSGCSSREGGGGAAMQTPFRPVATAQLPPAWDGAGGCTLRSQPHQHVCTITFRRHVLRLTISEPLPRMYGNLRPGTERQPEPRSQAMLRMALAALRPALVACGAIFCIDPQREIDSALFLWAAKPENFRGAVHKIGTFEPQKVDPKQAWWSQYVSTSCESLNSKHELLGLRGPTRLIGASNSHGGYGVCIEDVTESTVGALLANKRLREAQLKHQGAMDFKRCQTREDQQTEGARQMITGSVNGWNLARREQMLHTEGRRAGPKPGPHRTTLRVPRPGRIVVRSHKEQMAAEVSNGHFIHRSNGTGRCTLLEQQEAIPGHAVVGAVPRLHEWIPLMLRSEERRGRLVQPLEQLVRAIIPVMCFMLTVLSARATDRYSSMYFS